MDEKLERLEKANKLIEVIAKHGLKFFFSKQNKWNGKDTLAQFEFGNRNRLYFTNNTTGDLLYMHSDHWRKKSTHGYTMQKLVTALKNYILKGTKLPDGILGPWPVTLCGGDLWRYGDDMEIIRTTAKELELIQK